MEPTSIARARKFVTDADLPRAPQRSRARGGGAQEDTVAVNLQTAKDQAAVVGSDVMAFVKGVTAERRESIINSSLLAQLVAKKKVTDPEDIQGWYNAYFDVLTNIGWVVQDKSFAVYQENNQNFETHKAILAVATVLLGAAPAALTLVTTTINALQSMDESTPWITVFNRESQTARAARFQVSLVEQSDDGQFLVSLMAFSLEAKASITQVLFFKARAKETTLRHSSGRVTINTTVLDGVRDALKAKITSHATEFVKTLPDLD